MKIRKIKMWHVLLSLFLGLGVALGATYPIVKDLRQEREQERQDIYQLHREFNDALITKDLEALDRLLARHFEYYTVAYGVLDKAQLIENVRNGTMQFHAMDAVKTVEITGNQSINRMKVGGKFWGEEGIWEIEQYISSLERQDGRKARRLSVKILEKVR